MLLSLAHGLPASPNYLPTEALSSVCPEIRFAFLDQAGWKTFVGGLVLALQVSPSAAPATKSALRGSQSAVPVAKSRFTKCCACHEICTSRFTKCCACHEICTSRFTKRCTCHEICTCRSTCKCCACHEICAQATCPKVTIHCLRLSRNRSSSTIANMSKVLHLPRKLHFEAKQLRSLAPVTTSRL